MSDLEQRLEAVFASDARARRVERVHLAPRSSGGPLAGVAFVAAVSLAVVAAIVALGPLRPQDRGPVAASASPLATASASAVPSASATPTSSPSPSASPAAAARPERLLGYISHGSGGAQPILRTEADATPIRTFPSEMTVAATRDGRRVAYVRTGQTGQQLLVFDTARATGERTVLDFNGTGEFAGELVWASDADEVLIAIHKMAGTSGAKEYSRLVAVEMASGRTREIYRSTSGLSLEPLAWRASTATASAIETGPGGYAVTYVHVKGGTAARHAMDAQVIASSVSASPDGERIVQVDGLGRAPARGVIWWQADRYGDRQRLALDGHDVSVALWRPGADELIVFVVPGTKTASPGPRIERWSLGGAKRTVREVGNPPAVIRVDGSAVITTGGVLVDLETGDATPIPGARIDLWPRVAVAF